MDEYPAIQLYQGATSVVQVDLEDFDMQGGSVVLTVRRRKPPRTVVASFEMAEPGVHDVVFKDEETALLEVGEGKYEYDVMWHVGEERFPQCAPSPVSVARTVGGLIP